MGEGRESLTVVETLALHLEYVGHCWSYKYIYCFKSLKSSVQSKIDKYVTDTKKIFIIDTELSKLNYRSKSYGFNCILRIVL